MPLVRRQALVHRGSAHGAPTSVSLTILTTRRSDRTSCSALRFCSFMNAREGVGIEGAPVFGLRKESFTMPKGQEKSKTTNKPKLTVKEKKAKKKEKAASK
jgi:hypothetical protein